MAVTIGGVDRTSLFAVGVSEATGRPEAPLGESVHQVCLTVRDLTGNLGEASGSFSVDTVAPTASGSFLSGTSPQVVLVYSDVAGSGVDPASVELARQESLPSASIGTSVQVRSANFR